MKYWFIFCGSDLLLEHKPDNTYTIPQVDSCILPKESCRFIHEMSPMSDGKQVTTAEICDKSELESFISSHHQYEMIGLRQSFHLIDNELYLMAGKCREIIYWDSQHQYCGICGAPMQMHTDISKRCTSCGNEIWPLLATAIIVLIHRGDEVLLVRARNFRGTYYGLVAGFVETGETLEQAVQREAHEETGIKITNIRYFDSQPWPYPCGLMVGFEADYVSGDLCIQEEELCDAAWFAKDRLPAIPDKLSIARRLIDHWIDS